MKLLPPTVLLIITGIFLSSCKSTYFFRSNYNSANQLLHSTSNSISKPFLKAHMQNGDVLILKDSWEIDTIQNSVLGSGDQYNYKRRLVYSGEIEISIDSVALFETNSKLIKPEEGRIAGLAIMGGLDVILSIICATVPKACWGSCPTFYLEPNENVHYAEAEGFSNAVLPSMEYGDYDDLGVINPGHTKVLDLIMKNEALETHSVNKLKLFTFPLKANERVIISSDNAFYTTNGRYKVQSATAEEGDILKLIQSADKFERTSLADEQNLATKEEIILTFEDVDFSETLGLSLTFRQTLMSTYLIYTGIDYMGYSMGDIVADIERQQNMDDILKRELLVN